MRESLELPAAPDKSKYVRGVNGELIDIDSVHPDHRYAKGPYQCLSCGQSMVPALGSQRAHHFKHKAQRPIDCRHETYLHELAKLTVFSAVSNAMLLGTPYTLTLMAPMACDRFYSEAGFICGNGRVPKSFDITSKFNGVELERGVNGFVADILLSSSRSAEILAIEIAVTHPCDREKIKSGLRIIEIELRSEDQIESLWHGIDATHNGVTTYNLAALETVKQRCVAPCQTMVTVLLLYKNGKPWFSKCELAKLGELTNDPHLVTWEIAQGSGAEPMEGYRCVPQGLKEFILKQGYEYGRKVKSCLICRHIRGSQGQNDVNCAAKGGAVWMSSSAVSCSSYSPTRDI